MNCKFMPSSESINSDDNENYVQYPANELFDVNRTNEESDESDIPEWADQNISDCKFYGYKNINDFIRNGTSRTDYLLFPIFSIFF